MWVEVECCWCWRCGWGDDSVVAWVGEEDAAYVDAGFATVVVTHVVCDFWKLERFEDLLFEVEMLLSGMLIYVMTACCDETWIVLLVCIEVHPMAVIDFECETGAQR